MTLQLKSARLDDAFFSSRKSHEDFSNMKRYSTELTRQFIWSLQKSFRPSFCLVWDNSYFFCFLAHWPGHLLTSGSSLDHVCTPEYLLGNQSEGSSDPAKHSVVNVLYPRVPRFSHRPSTYPPTTCSDFCQSGHSLIHLLSPQWFVQTREFKPIWKEQSGELCCGFQPQILFNVTTLAGRPQKKKKNILKVRGRRAKRNIREQDGDGKWERFCLGDSAGLVK